MDLGHPYACRSSVRLTQFSRTNLSPHHARERKTEGSRRRSDTVRAMAPRGGQQREQGMAFDS